MRKLALIFATILLLAVPKSTRSQDAQTLVPYFLSMIDGLSRLDDAVKDSEKQLDKISNTLGAVRDAKRFMEYALEVRITVNNLACLGEQIRDMNLIFNGLGINQSNLLSEFLECQYSIYYQGIEIEYNLIGEKIERSFDLQEQLDIKTRLQLIDEVLTSMENIRFKTINAQQGLVELLEDEMILRQDLSYYNLINKL